MDVPPQYANGILYKKARKMIDRQYGPRTSAWKSMALVKKYKELGGAYETKTSTRSSKSKTNSLQKWRKERWIQVVPYVVSMDIVSCGSSRRGQHACRPLVRVTKNTPVTLPELLRIHTKRKLIALARLKHKQQPVRINWTKGTYTIL